MQYDFDRVVSRAKNFSAKYDERVKNFGTDQVIPLWIADMDFPTAQPIIDAAVRRAQEGIHQGMGHHVCIGVPQQPQVVRNLHPAQNQFPAGHQPVYVIAMSDSHRPILSAKMAWPQVRSRGVVIFKLSSLPRVR